MIEQHQELYIPTDERSLRRAQRRVHELDKGVRDWAQSVIAILPRGLAILEDEAQILALYLAQQRRLNLEMDARSGEETLRARLGRVIPFLADGEDDWDMMRAIHKMVAARLETNTEQACQRFCDNLGIPPVCDPAIDWRVAIRYMAQEVHRLTSQMGVTTRYSAPPQRFDLALAARDLAIEVSAKRRDMLKVFLPDRDSA